MISGCAGRCRISKGQEWEFLVSGTRSQGSVGESGFLPTEFSSAAQKP